MHIVEDHTRQKKILVSHIYFKQCFSLIYSCVIGGWYGRVNKIIHINKYAVWRNESFPDCKVMFSRSLPCKLLLPSTPSTEEEGENTWLTDTALTMLFSLDRGLPLLTSDSSWP